MTTAHNIDLPAVLAERLTTAHPDVLREAGGQGTGSTRSLPDVRLLNPWDDPPYPVSTIRLHWLYGSRNHNCPSPPPRF